MKYIGKKLIIKRTVMISKLKIIKLKKVFEDVHLKLFNISYLL